eukprot:g11388.t1
MALLILGSVFLFQLAFSTCPNVDLRLTQFIYTESAASLLVGQTYSFQLQLKLQNGSDFSGVCLPNGNLDNLVISVGGPSNVVVEATRVGATGRYTVRILGFVTGAHTITLQDGSAVATFPAALTFVAGPNRPLLQRVTAGVVGHASMSKLNQVPDVLSPAPVPCLTTNPLAGFSLALLSGWTFSTGLLAPMANITAAHLEDVFTVLIGVANSGGTTAYDARISFALGSCWKLASSFTLGSCWKLASRCGGPNLRVQSGASLFFTGDAGNFTNPSLGLRLGPLGAASIAFISINVQLAPAVGSRDCAVSLTCPLGVSRVHGYSAEASGLNYLLYAPNNASLQYHAQPLELTAPSKDMARSTAFLPQLVASQGGLLVGASGLPFVRLPLLYHTSYHSSAFQLGPECGNARDASRTKQPAPQSLTCYQYWFLDIDFLTRCQYSGSYTLEGSVRVEVSRDFTQPAASTLAQAAVLQYAVDLAGALSALPTSSETCLDSSSCNGYNCAQGRCACPANIWRDNCLADQQAPIASCPGNQVLYVLQDTAATLAAVLGPLQAPRFFDDQPSSLPLPVLRRVDRGTPTSLNGSQADLGILQISLAPGRHNIQYQVWDAANNTASCSLDVLVLALDMDLTLTVHNETELTAFLGNYSSGQNPTRPQGLDCQGDFNHQDTIGLLLTVAARSVAVTRADLIWLNATYFVDAARLGFLYETPLYSRDQVPAMPPFTQSLHEYPQHVGLLYTENQFPEAAKYWITYTAQVEVTYGFDPFAPVPGATRRRLTLSQASSPAGSVSHVLHARRTLASHAFSPNKKHLFGSAYCALQTALYNHTPVIPPPPPFLTLDPQWDGRFSYQISAPYGWSIYSWSTLGWTINIIMWTFCLFCLIWNLVCTACIRRRRRRRKKTKRETNERVNVNVEMNNGDVKVKEERLDEIGEGSDEETDKLDREKAREKRKKKKEKARRESEKASKRSRRDQVSPTVEAQRLNDRGMGIGLSERSERNESKESKEHDRPNGPGTRQGDHQVSIHVSPGTTTQGLDERGTRLSDDQREVRHPDALRSVSTTSAYEV